MSASDLSAAEVLRLTKLFHKIDKDGSKTLTKDECAKYWKSTENAEQMLEELDADEDGMVSIKEWLAFFTKLKGNADSLEDFEGVIAYVEAGEA